MVETLAIDELVKSWTMGEELKQRGYESAMKSVLMLERKKEKKKKKKEREGKEAVESLLCFVLRKYNNIFPFFQKFKMGCTKFLFLSLLHEFTLGWYHLGTPFEEFTHCKTTQPGFPELLRPGIKELGTNVLFQPRSNNLPCDCHG